MLKKILCFALAAFMLCGMSFTVSAADEGTVVYENDFSDAATLSEFKQLRAKWEIKDGKLWMTEPAEDITDPQAFGFLILNKDVSWKNYTVEADIENVQSSTGIFCRADINKASAENDNSFTGFLGFLSNNAQSGAMGRTGADGISWGGNYSGSVIAAGTTIGSSVHMKVTVIDDTFTLEIFDLDTGVELYNNIVVSEEWTSGTIGFRVRSTWTSTGANSFNTVSFDNLKVTCFDPVEETVTTEAPATEAPATEAPATEAPATEAPVVTDAPVDTTVAPATPEDTPATGDATVMVVFAAAAVLCVAAVVVIKKRET